MLNIHTPLLLAIDFKWALGGGDFGRDTFFTVLHTAEDGTRSLHLLQLTITVGPFFLLSLKFFS